MTTDAEKLLRYFCDKLGERSERGLAFKVEDLKEITDACTKISRLLKELKDAQHIEDYEVLSDSRIQVRLLPGSPPQPEIKTNDKMKGKSKGKDLVSQEIYELVKRKFLNGKNKGEHISLEKFEAYSKLFQYFISVKSDDSKELTVDNYFEFIVDKVHEANNEDYVKVLGPDGTGKSTFLSILYMYLYEKFTEKKLKEYPFYINLHYYDSNVINADSMEELNRIVEKEIKDDLNKLIEYSKRNPKINFMIIIDGNDTYDRSHLKSAIFLENILARLKGHKKIICLGEKTNIHYYREKKTDANYIDKATTYTFCFSPIFRNERSKWEAVVRDFCEMYQIPKQADKILRCIDKFKIKEIDHNLLTIFCDVSRKTDLGNISSVSDLYRQYCLDYLEGDERRLEVSVGLSYRYFMAGDFIEQQYISSHWEEWELVHQHKTISNYLLAVYYDKLIQEGNIEKVRQFEYVFTNGINVFLKLLLNRKKEKQKRTLNFCRGMFEKGGFMAKAQAAYMVGRLKDPDLQEEAKQLLSTQLKEWSARNVREKNEKRKKCFVKRSILVSLLNLGDSAAGQILLKDFFESSIMNEVNRAFYLQYYEDITNMETVKVNLKDEGKDKITNTASVLFNYINMDLTQKNGTWNTKESYDFQIHLFTICSLLQRRLQDEKMSSEVDRLSAVISKTMKDHKNNIEERMQEYIIMLQEDIDKRVHNSIGHLYHELYKLKDVPRAGWEKKIKPGCIEGKYENVVEHTYYAWLMGMLYLPDDKPAELEYDKYDKKKILNCLLIHDLAEAYVGDILPEDRTERSEEEERECMRRIFMHETYPGIAIMGDYKRIWEKFETKFADINGQIAKDIDRIQAIYQFCLYKRMGAKFEEKKEEEWLEEKYKIKTSVGRDILEEIVVKNFRDIIK